MTQSLENKLLQKQRETVDHILHKGQDNLLSRLGLINHLAQYVTGEAAIFHQSMQMRYIELTNNLFPSHIEKMYILAYELLESFMMMDEAMKKEDASTVNTEPVITL